MACPSRQGTALFAADMPSPAFQPCGRILAEPPRMYAPPSRGSSSAACSGCSMSIGSTRYSRSS
eukprot:2933971-Prymnesium_polylepis.1